MREQERREREAQNETEADAERRRILKGKGKVVCEEVHRYSVTCLSNLGTTISIFNTLISKTVEFSTETDAIKWNTN